MEQWLQAHREELIADTVRILQMDTVKAEPAPEAPFGQGVADCLAAVLARCGELGFKTHNEHGYYGYAELGEGDPLLGILVHLDVVPPGQDWTDPPFSAVIRDGKIYARGAVDDKSPAMCAVYAAKAAEQAGFAGRVRIIFGCDEESGWGCMNAYMAREEIPAMAFSPDADYPLINTEKTILHVALSRTYDEPCPVRLKAGERANVVPDRAELTDESGRTRVFAGVGAHASTPEKGANALWAPLAALSDESTPWGQDCARIFRTLADQSYGQGLDLFISDEVSGHLTVNLGILELNESGIRFVLDLRIPVTADPEEIKKAIAAHYPGFALEVLSLQMGHHVPADSPLVQTLLQVYRDLTGLPGEAMAIGGGTYARAFPNAVAFGPTLPGTPELAHQKDENIPVDELLLNARIFAHAITKLLTRPQA